MDGKPVFAATVNEVAGFFGLKRRAVDEWLARGCPGKSDQGYDLSAIAQWARANVWSQHAGKQNRAELEDEKLRLEVQREALKLRKEAGELVSRKAAKAALSQACNALRAKVESLPEEIAAVCPADQRADVLRSIRHIVELTLREISQMTSIEGME